MSRHRLRHVRIGAEAFHLDADVAERVAALCATDQGAGLALARRSDRRVVPDGAVLHAPIMLMDTAPNHGAEDRSTKMSEPKMTSLTIGDAQIHMDARAAEEIERLRGEVKGQQGVIQALSDTAARNAAAPGTAGLNDAAALRDQAAATMRAMNDRKHDVTTPYGKYCIGLGTAYRAAGAPSA